MAGPKPKSLNISEKLTTVKANPIKPNSVGLNNLAKIANMENCKIALVALTPPNHKKPEKVFFAKLLFIGLLIVEFIPLHKIPNALFYGKVGVVSVAFS